MFIIFVICFVMLLFYSTYVDYNDQFNRNGNTHNPMNMTYGIANNMDNTYTLSNGLLLDMPIELYPYNGSHNTRQHRQRRNKKMRYRIM